MAKQHSDHQPGFERVAGSGNPGFASLFPLVLMLGTYAGVQVWRSPHLLADLRGADPASSLRTVTSPVPATETFRQAVNTAMSAARLTQFAKTPEEWRLVASQWEGAIATLQTIPTTEQSWPLAQQKVAEYQRNLSYARRNAGDQSGPSPRRPGQAPRAISTPSSQTRPNSALNLNLHQSGTWLRVATTANQESIYIDSDSIVRSLPYVEFWQRTISSPARGKTWIRDQRWVANCQTHELINARENRASKSAAESSRFLKPIQASLFNAICGQERPHS
jgi:hypothetical protein